MLQLLGIGQNIFAASKRFLQNADLFDHLAKFFRLHGEGAVRAAVRLRKIARLHKPMIFATGIAYPEDIERALAVCKQEGSEDVILLKCVSSYPTPYEAVNLNVIPT